MGFTPLQPDENDTQFTITVPKEITPYLRDFFYPNKKIGNETLEEYIVRVLSDYGIKVFLEDMNNAIAASAIASLEAEQTNIQNSVESEQAAIEAVAATIKAIFEES